jgi:uncharacterized membrane protein YjgN (DUF898 family)
MRQELAQRLRLTVHESILHFNDRRNRVDDALGRFSVNQHSVEIDPDWSHQFSTTSGSKVFIPSSTESLPDSSSRETLADHPETSQVEVEREVFRLTFHGDGQELFGIFISNLLKTIASLGVYSFWGKVKTRQYVWGQAEFSGDRFGYHGTGRELLLGWIKAVVFFGSIVAIQNVLPLVWNHILAPVLAAGIFYGGLAVLIPLARIGSMGYRMSRSSWRGIRFSFRGGYWPLFRLSLRGYLLNALTFGLYYPYFDCQVRKFMIDNSYFGSARFTFDWEKDELKKLWGVYAASLGSTIILFPLSLFLMSALFSGLFGSMGFVLALIGSLVACSWLWVIFIAERRRFVWNHTKFGNARFRSTIEDGQLGRLYGVNALLALISLGVALPWIKVRTLRYNLEHLMVQGSIDFRTIVQEAGDAPSTGDALAGFFDVDTIPT